MGGAFSGGLKGLVFGGGVKRLVFFLGEGRGIGAERVWKSVWSLRKLERVGRQLQFSLSVT